MLMKLLTTLLVISIAAGRIIFQYEEQHVEKQKGVKGIKRPSNHSTYCPEGGDWCDKPYDYPEHTILKAVAKQKKAVKIMFENENIPAKDINKTSEIGLRMFEPEEAELEPALRISVTWRPPTLSP